jgi:uncharacterized membrane protein
MPEGFSMGVTANGAWWAILLGIVSTSQTHLAKALERQGIEALDLIRARFRGPDKTVEGATAKSWIYAAGLLLNHTTFLYHLFVAPLGGTTGLYTSMYGTGLIVLLLYSTLVMKEKISRAELAGVVSILLGTLMIGIDGIGRPLLDMSAMDLAHTVMAVGILLAICVFLLALSLRNGAPHTIGVAFGLCAGACGALDPFLKALGQTTGGGNTVAPHTTTGWIILASSFLIGEIAVLVTQWGFYKRARANVLVPAYNCSYIAVPVALQAGLLPGYALCPTTGLGLAAIMLGFVLVRGLGRGSRVVAERVADEAGT